MDPMEENDKESEQRKDNNTNNKEAQQPDTIYIGIVYLVENRIFSCK